MSDDKTISGEYSTGNFTYDHLESGDFAPFEKLERSMGEKNPDSAIGIIGGKYRLDKILGQGGMGKIYLATQLKLNRKVAIKVMLAPDDNEATRRFEKEASVTANLTHPNTVRIFDFGVMEDGFLYLVMEHLDGIDIKTHLKTKGAFEPLLAASLISEVCGALLEAHNKGIVHRDIKPGNIMLVNNPEGGLRSKLLDFGLVKSLEGSTNRTRTGIILGSPMYMSPEQVESQPVSAASDIYSLGLTLYNMLTNSRPFQEESLTGILSAHLLRYPKPLWESRPELTHYPGLIWIVNRAFQKKTTDRFQSAAQMKKALDSFIQNPKCGFIFQNGELQVTEKFIYDNQEIESSGAPKRTSKKGLLPWFVGAGLAGVLGVGLMFADPENESRVLSEPEVVKKNVVANVAAKEEKFQSPEETPEPVKEEMKKEQPLQPVGKMVEQVAVELAKKENQKFEDKKKEKKTQPLGRALEGVVIGQAGKLQQSAETKETSNPEEVLMPRKPETRKLTISIISGLDEVLSVKASCGEYSNSWDITGSSPFSFTKIPQTSCDLRFELVSGSYLTAKNVPVEFVECSVGDSVVRCE